MAWSPAYRYGELLLANSAYSFPQQRTMGTSSAVLGLRKDGTKLMYPPLVLFEMLSVFLYIVWMGWFRRGLAKSLTVPVSRPSTPLGLSGSGWGQRRAGFFIGSMGFTSMLLSFGVVALQLNTFYFLIQDALP